MIGTLLKRSEVFVLIELLVDIVVIALLLAFLKSALQRVKKVGFKELWMLKRSRGYNIADPWTMAGGVT